MKPSHSAAAPFFARGSAVRRHADGEGLVWLGLDFGTSKVAAVLIAGDGRVLTVRSRPHRADLPVPQGRAEQDARRTLRCARALVRSLPASLRRRVGGVGIAAQMHGVLLVDRRGRPLTPLVTWQDARAIERPGWLAGLRRRARRMLQAGYGAVTLAWWRRSRIAPSRGAALALNIGDVVVAELCGLPRPPMTESIADSWGVYDSLRHRWDRAALARLHVPLRWLPGVVSNGSAAGTVSAQAARAWGLPAGIPVTAAVGDQAAAAFATVREPAQEIAVTVGTGAQAAVVCRRCPRSRPSGARWEYRPYFGGQWLCTAASLNGGAAWRWLAELVQDWCAAATGRRPPRGEVFGRLNRLGRRARREVLVDPCWFGERGEEGRTGRIERLGPIPPRLGELARGVARGIARNLRERLPAIALRGRRRIVASGNALRRNPLLRDMVRREFGLPMALSPAAEETAVGAALLARELTAPRRNRTRHLFDRRTARRR
ncbi:MAG: FGGY family carbohydrate kinase [Kiritimatiellae bacterium]|nr:FGGY family carbohydrate kinase [Kiritimatiellia bacterium]